MIYLRPTLGLNRVLSILYMIYLRPTLGLNRVLNQISLLYSTLEYIRDQLFLRDMFCI